MLPLEQQIRTAAQLDQWLKYEKAQYGVGFRHVVGAWLGVSEKGILWRHQFYLRHAEYHTNAHHKIRAAYYRFRLRRIETRCLLSIPLNTCAMGLRIMHLGLVRINPNCQIGKDCRFHVNTVLAPKGISAQSPCLGDDIIVGVGAVIVGGVHIANHVAIGANAVVTKDITEENVAVAGVPAKIVSRNGAVAWGEGNKNKN